MYPDEPGELFFVVVVSGGAGSGIFVYSPSFALGNLIVSITAGTTGPLGETGLLPGIANYQEVGGNPGLVIQILNGVISFLDQQSADPLVKTPFIDVLHQSVAGSHPIMAVNGPANNATGNQPVIWLRGSATGDNNSQVILFNAISASTFQVYLAGTLWLSTIGGGGLAVPQSALSLGPANEFQFDHPLIALAAAAANLAYETLVTGDTNNRWQVDATGKQQWGPGNAALDTNLYRSAAGVLKTDFALTVTLALTANGGATVASGLTVTGGETADTVAVSSGQAAGKVLTATNTTAAPSGASVQFLGAGAGDRLLQLGVTGDTSARFLADTNGTMKWGSGSATQDCSLDRQAANIMEFLTCDVDIATAGKGLKIKTGSNAKLGTAVLVGGTVTVANTSVTANSIILPGQRTPGGTPGALFISAVTVGTGFTIKSTSSTDTSTVGWLIVEAG